MRGLLSLIILLSLGACSGGKSTKTGFKLEISGSAVTSTSGGLVIFGKSTTGSRFSRVISTNLGTGTIVEEIPSGTWDFGAVGWNASVPFTGNILCAFSFSRPVSGSSMIIDLKLTNQRCFDSDVVVPNTFSGSGVKAFRNANLNLCQGDVSGVGATECAYGITIRPVVKGFGGGFKLFVPGERKTPNSSTVLSSEYLESRCYNSDTLSEPVSGTYSINELNIPAFLPSVGFPLQILSYLGSQCEPGKGVITRNFTIPAEAKIVSDGTQNYLNVSASTDAVCGAALALNPQNTSTPAAGNGTDFSPWLICTEEQFRAIQQNIASTWWPTNVKDGVYVLGRNLDLLKFIQKTAGQCLREGDTMVPIGKTYNPDYPTCSMGEVATGSTFKFDGDGRTIRGFRFMNPNQSNVGLFGGTVSGSIYDLVIEDSEVEGDDNTAILVGNKMGGTVKMIRVKNSRVDGDNRTGGIIGHANSTTNFYKLYGINVEVDGFSETGGLVGHVNSGSITDAYFRGSVYAESGAQHIGGVAGQVLGSITNAVAEGAVRSSGTFMGGIAGRVTGVVQFARSDVFINDYKSDVDDPRMFGGIAGHAGQVRNSLFMGAIATDCLHADCDIGAIAGTFTTASTRAYSTFTNPNDGDDGNEATFSLTSIFAPGADNTICNGEAGCTFIQPAGDKPRINTLEAGVDTPVCSLPENTADLSVQDLTPHFRGSAAKPFIICKPSQLQEIADHGGQSFALGDHINISETSALSLGAAGNFSGHFDGRGNSLFGFTDSTTADSAIFSSIVASATVKNLTIAGARIDSTACTGTCFLAPLALFNDGRIENVTVEDVSIKAITANTETGGLVSLNNTTGTITQARVWGHVESRKNVGGIAFTNAGNVSQSKTDLRINGRNESTNTGMFGGIVGVNSGVVSRNRYDGMIEYVNNAEYIGGIVAYMDTGSVISENEFADEAFIYTAAGTSKVGGIAGFSNAAGALLTKNLSRGTIKGSSVVATAKSLVGTGSFTDTGFNYKMTVPQVYIESLAGSGSSFVSGTCQLNILGYIVGNGGANGVSGMIAVNNKFYHGTLDDDGTDFLFTTRTRNQSECSNLETTLGVYKTMGETRQNLSLATLRNTSTYNWDIADMLADADRTRVFNTYIEILTGKTPSNPPVWIFDPNERGLELFLKD